MNKKLMIGLIVAAVVIIVGVGGFYLWGKASADVATKDFCNGLTKQADWNKCAKNVIVLRSEMARLDSVRFKKVWRNMYNLRNFVPGSVTTISPSPVTTVSSSPTTSISITPTVPGATKPVYTSSLLSAPLVAGENSNVTLTFIGYGFGLTQGTSTVKLGSIDLQVVSWSDTKVVCNINPSKLTVGTYGVILKTDGGSITVNVTVSTLPDQAG